MKKFVIFLVIVMIIVCTISYLYFNYVSYNQEIRNSNLEFEQYLNKELNGNDVGSIINKAIDYNEKNEIQKDDDGLYIEPEYTGKNTLTYIDDEQYGIVTDYLGVQKEFHTPSGIHMEPADYSLTLTNEYIKFIMGVTEYEY